MHVVVAHRVIDYHGLRMAALGKDIRSLECLSLADSVEKL
jgi:hypothetical protein